MSETKTLPSRQDVPVEETWDLEKIYKNTDEWEQDYERVKELAPAVAAFKGKLGESSETLYQAFQKRDELLMVFNKIAVYAHMKADQDTTNATYQALNDRMGSLGARVSSQLAFFVPEVLSLSEDQLMTYVDENDDLKLYKHEIEDINRERPHVLSEEKEALLAEASEIFSASSKTFNMLNNADMEFPEMKDEDGNTVQISHGSYMSLIRSKDRSVREEAFKKYQNTFYSFKNTFASTYSANVKKNNFNAKIRGFDSARQAALSGNNIPETVYDTLVKSVNDNLPLLHRYVELRKKALGVDELHYYDLYTPLVKDTDQKIKYNEAKEKVLEGLKPMGEDYLDTIRKGYDSRWIDVRETKGKRNGAYSSGTYGTMPYILLNWNDNFDDLFTLAHELGHSMHSYYTTENQPFPYADYTIFVAEVASTCNEALLNHHLLENTDDEQVKKHLINHQLEGYRGTVFRQTMFAEFEQIAHEKAANGEALTADLLNEVYYNLTKKYFGDQIVIDDEIAIEWARIPHFYRSFYVYQYATGFCAANTLSQKILKEGEPAVEDYKGFLKSGSSDYSINVLKKAGVDMTSPEPINTALKGFGDLLDRMEKLI